MSSVRISFASPSFETVQKLCDALADPAAVLLGGKAESAAQGRRGELLGKINAHLADLNDDDLDRVEAMIQAFAR